MKKGHHCPKNKRRGRGGEPGASAFFVFKKIQYLKKNGSKRSNIHSIVSLDSI